MFDNVNEKGEIKGESKRVDWFVAMSAFWQRKFDQFGFVICLFHFEIYIILGTLMFMLIAHMRSVFYCAILCIS